MHLATRSHAQWKPGSRGSGPRADAYRCGRWVALRGVQGNEPALGLGCVSARRFQGGAGPPARLYTRVLPRFAATPARVIEHVMHIKRLTRTCRRGDEVNVVEESSYRRSPGCSCLQRRGRCVSRGHATAPVPRRPLVRTLLLEGWCAAARQQPTRRMWTAARTTSERAGRVPAQLRATYAETQRARSCHSLLRPRRGTVVVRNRFVYLGCCASTRFEVSWTRCLSDASKLGSYTETATMVANGTARNPDKVATRAACCDALCAGARMSNRMEVAV